MSNNQLMFFHWVRFFKKFGELPEEERPSDYIYEHDILLFDWLEEKRSKEKMKRINPNMQSAEDKDNVFIVS